MELGAAKYRQGKTSDVIQEVFYVLFVQKQCNGNTLISPMIHANASDAVTMLAGNDRLRYLGLIVVSFLV